MVTKDFTVRLGQDEIGYILDRKENLDHHSQLWDHMSRYRDLGWTLAVIGVQDGVDLKLDLSQPKELWWKQLADLGLDGVQVNLAVRTGRASRLLVLEVNKGEGTLSLDRLGDWRAQCVAEMGNGRERHYYSLPPEKQPPASFSAGEVSIYGEGALVLAPTSLEPGTREQWRWVTPPWVSSPQPPKAALWQFLREQQGETGPESQEMLSWEEAYQTIALHEGVLKAWRAPSAAMSSYYRDILMASLAAGLRDRRLLLGLLWHAPHGDARTNEERWQFLKSLLVEDQLSAPEFRPEAGAAAAGFDPSVYEQYFKLLAALGEQVVAESCRQKTILSGLEAKVTELSGLEAKVTELDRMVAEIERCFPSPATGSPEGKGFPPAQDRVLLEFPWAASMARPPETTKKLQEVKSMVKDFLGKNPDLAADQDTVQMVLFCLKNYVSIDPEFAGMSFQEKLEEAGHMARGFLGHAAKAK